MRRLIALLLGWYAASNLEAGASFAYFKTLAEFESAKAELRGHDARVHGYVALGSIERDLAAKQVRFHVQATPPHAGGAPGEPLEVVFGSLETPDLFKDGAEVVVEGRLSETGRRLPRRQGDGEVPVEVRGRARPSGRDLTGGCPCPSSEPTPFASAC